MKTTFFNNHAEQIIGELFLPNDFDTKVQYPAIIVTGSWTTVKEQMANFYAARFNPYPFITLTFDFRHFGESEGQPRKLENPFEKTSDIIAAVTYLQTLPFVNPEQIFGLGICASTGYMADAAALDSRIKAIALVAPWMLDRSIVEEIYGGKQGVDDKIATGTLAQEKYRNTGIMDFMPAADPEDKLAAMPLPNVEHWEYYYRKDLGAIPQYRNRFAVAS